MSAPDNKLFSQYDHGEFFCEMLGTDAAPASHTEELVRRMNRMKIAALRRRAQASDRELFNLGITFTVYSEKDAIDRVLPFDVIPRVISSEDWQQLESGCVQRVTALNKFIHDIYHEQRILADGIVPG